MRVALLSPLIESVPPKLYGGTERVVYHLCQGLTRAGVDVHLYASGDSEPPAGTTLVPVITKSLRLSSEPINDPNAYHFRMLGHIARDAKHFDIIHNHADYPLLALSRMTDTPLITTFHNRLDNPDLAAAIENFAADSTFISISRSHRSALPHLPWVKTIYHGLPLEKFKFYPKPGKYLAFLGRVFREKRPEWAIEIAKRAGIPLKIAAKIEGPESQAHFDHYIRPHLDGRNVEYVGEISEHEKADFLGNALGLAFPIDWPEPFGLVMIEALACGTPVLARPAGAAPEILKDGVTGFMSPDLGELARRVGDLQSISRTGCRAWVEERFSLGRMTEEYLDAYRRVARGFETAASA